MTTDSIISKVWSFCHTLRDDGVGYGDYLEQLTYLIFLKMADECSKPPYRRKVGVPDLFWLKDESLADLDNLPEPTDLAEEIVENLEAGLASFRAVASTLGG